MQFFQKINQKSLQVKFKQSEDNPPSRYKPNLKKNLPKKKFIFISFNIIGLKNYIGLIVSGILKIVEIIFNMLTGYPLVSVLLLLFLIGVYLPTEKIKALGELLKSLAALFS